MITFESGVPDPRLKQIKQLSLGWRMMEFAGYVDAPPSDKKIYLSFCTFYEAYSDKKT
jgi:hypothetical protein